jgi:uncharacterized protein
MSSTVEPDDRLSATKPLAQADRLAAIDILRGVALFGVMAINLVFESRVSIFLEFLSPDKAAPPLDQMVESFLNQAVSLKAFALFSLLFGMGLAMQFDRLPADRRAVLLLRRLLVLLVIGLVHLTLIWDGDILTEYALAGLLVLPILSGPRWLVGISALAFLSLNLTGYLFRLVPLYDGVWIGRQVVAPADAYGAGGFPEILSFRLGELSAIAPLHIWIFPRTLALGYGCFIIAAASTPLGSKLLGWAAPLGRMAFTNYLMQSLLFGFTFYGYGFGLFGKLGAATALAFGVVVYALQATVSRWWLSHFNFGPVEWLWRSLMYGQWQAMRRKTSPGVTVPAE